MTRSISNIFKYIINSEESVHKQHFIVTLSLGLDKSHKINLYDRWVVVDSYRVREMWNTGADVWWQELYTDFSSRSSYTVQINVQSLTLEYSIHIQLLKAKSFSVLTENSILRGGPPSMICDITDSFEANSGPIFELYVIRIFIHQWLVHWK